MNTTSTLVKAFVPLPGGAHAVYDSTGLKYYRHPDWLGSSRIASAPNRTLYFSGAYAPYGEDYAKSGTTDLSFTGQNQTVLAGIYDFLYRRYNPVQGRWMSPDPAGMAAVEPSNPQTWNRYTDVGNNPMSSTDPLGLCPPGYSQRCNDPTTNISDLSTGYNSKIARCGIDPFCIAAGGINPENDAVAHGHSDKDVIPFIGNNPGQTLNSTVYDLNGFTKSVDDNGNTIYLDRKNPNKVVDPINLGLIGGKQAWSVLVIDPLGAFSFPSLLINGRSPL